MVTDIDTDLLTISETAKLLKISTVTVHRWIKQGRLPVYHAGPRKVRIRRRDLATVLTPTFGEEVSSMKVMPISTTLTVRPMTEEEAQRGLEALERDRASRAQMLAEHGGKPLSSTAPLIRKAREERSKQLL